MKYNAFISYSHEKDTPLASNLEKALEKFAKPIFKRRALSLFRDQNNLSASPDLWGKIEEGLSQSDYFIFLASPKSGQSIWCNKEIDYWIKNKPSRAVRSSEPHGRNAVRRLKKLVKNILLNIPEDLKERFSCHISTGKSNLPTVLWVSLTPKGASVYNSRTSKANDCFVKRDVVDKE